MDGWMVDGDARYDSEDLLLGNRHAGYGSGIELDGVGKSVTVIDWRALHTCTRGAVGKIQHQQAVEQLSLGILAVGVGKAGGKQ